VPKVSPAALQLKSSAKLSTKSAFPFLFVSTARKKNSSSKSLSTCAQYAILKKCTDFRALEEPWNSLINTSTSTSSLDDAIDGRTRDNSSSDDDDDDDDDNDEQILKLPSGESKSGKTPAYTTTHEFQIFTSEKKSDKRNHGMT
jgi:hypothetical protein